MTQINKKTWTVTVSDDDEGNTIVPLPEDMIVELGWSIGDILNFTVEDDACVIENLSLKERQKNPVADL